jgi:hypothetical protein
MPNWAEAPLWDGYVADTNTLFVVQMFMMNWSEVGGYGVGTWLHGPYWLADWTHARTVLAVRLVTQGVSDCFRCLAPGASEW